MALRLMEHESGQSRGARLAERRRWSESELDRLAVRAARLAEGEPLQHVLGQAWFDGMALRVTPDVLIPRPETEELAAWMAGKLAEVSHSAPRALDWCTGSGCIALSLKKRVPRAEVHAWDVSEQALNVAQANAEALGLNVTAAESDLLSASPPSWPFHLVVSNPCSGTHGYARQGGGPRAGVGAVRARRGSALVLLRPREVVRRRRAFGGGLAWHGMPPRVCGRRGCAADGFRPLETRGNPGRLAGQAKACCGPT